MARAEDRYSALRIAHISSPVLGRHQVTVRNISKNGTSVIARDTELRVGDPVSVDFGGGDVRQGSVRWNRSEKMGISFL